MGKLIYVKDDGTTIELSIGEGLVVEGNTLKVVDAYVLNSFLDTFKLDKMLIS